MAGRGYGVAVRRHNSASAVLPRAAQWVKEARSAILLVPSYVARIERNVIINTAHAEAAGIETSLPEPVWWDERLFG